MNYLPKDLIYECLNFLDWKDYYDVCELFKMLLELKRYNAKSILDNNVTDIFNQEREYMEIIRYLYDEDHEKLIRFGCIYFLCKHGHLNSLKLFRTQLL